MGNTNKSGGLEEAKAAFAKDADGVGDKAGKVDDDAEFEDWAVLKRCRGHRGSKFIVTKDSYHCQKDA